MIIKNINIINMRGISEAKIDFDPRLTIIVGRNGAGKTTILDAISATLRIVHNIWPDENGQHRSSSPEIPNEDKRFGAENCSLKLEFQLNKENHPNSPTSVEIQVKEGIKKTSESVMEIYNYTVNNVASNEGQPLFIYYHQDRGFEKDRNNRNSSTRQKVLDNSLDGNLQAITDLEGWWDKRDAQEARTVRDRDPAYRDPQLEAIRKLVKAIDSFQDVSYNSTASPPGLYFRNHDGSMVHVDKLSTGERSYIILLADLARRLQTVSPSLELSQIPGIVLIDEIELNLHPAWQGAIIGSLTNVFKKCQFVITTHSPQIISSSESKHVRILSKKEDGKISVETPLNTKGRSSNYLLEGIFGSSERYPPVDKLIDEFNEAISDHKADLAIKLFKRIETAIEGYPPELIAFKKRLKKLEAKNEGS